VTPRERVELYEKRKAEGATAKQLRDEFCQLSLDEISLKDPSNRSRIKRRDLTLEEARVLIAQDRETKTSVKQCVDQGIQVQSGVRLLG